jgi:hypothetical protein
MSIPIQISFNLKRGMMILTIGMLICGLFPAPPAVNTAGMVAGAGLILLEDYSDIVTQTDLGFNDFSGNAGVVDDRYGHAELYCSDPQACALRFDWDFGSELEVFTGLFHSLFGLSDTTTTFDGEVTQTIAFPEHSLDLDQIDGLLIEPGGPRSIQEVCLQLSYQGAQELVLHLELKDTLGGVRFTRLPVPSSVSPIDLCWDFRDPLAYQIPPGSPDLDLNQAKIFALILERRHVAAGVDNPPVGALDIHKLWFLASRVDSEPPADQELLDLAERRAYQYFLDWSSRKPASRSIPQDRSTFGDLLTVGGIGFGLPAHIIAAERGWISHAEAVTRILDVLRLLDDPSAFGPEPVGRLGYRGWLYHFLGVDGRRKLNYDFLETPQDESLNTVELSTIDTGLAVMGVLAAQSYFDDPDDPDEIEIRTRAQAIYERVEWPFMLESVSNQFYLGWKPNELRDPPAFEIPDADGLGAFSGLPGNPATLDYYTDEALIVILLASASPTYPVDPGVYASLSAYRDEAGLFRTYPGALFTYQFLHAFLDTRGALPSCPAEDGVDWYTNSRQAIATARQYALDNPAGFLTYGADAWGISAAEGPFDAYRAYGAPPLAISPEPEEDGTLTYYAMLSAASYDADLRQWAIDSLRNAWSEGHWHGRFGLPDAFSAEISQAGTVTGALRTEGPWIQRALFAIDQGPMLLHLENARSGLVWRLLAANPNIQRGLQRLGSLALQTHMLEAETGSGDGQVMPRSAASNLATVWLLTGETRTVTFTSTIIETYTLQVRYSNDNFGPLEVVEVAVDGTPLGSFTAQDTGDSDLGWNVFLFSGPVGSLRPLPGGHQVTLTVTGGDGFGVEIDAVQLQAYTQRFCVSIPVVLK